MHVAEKTWLFWCAVVRRMPSDREHEFSQGGKSTSYEHVCLVTANSGHRIPSKQKGGALNTSPIPNSALLSRRSSECNAAGGNHISLLAWRRERRGQA